MHLLHGIWCLELFSGIKLRSTAVRMTIIDAEKVMSSYKGVIRGVFPIATI